MSSEDAVESEGLRKRNIPVQVKSKHDAREAVLRLNALENESSKNSIEKKTFGRTSDGTGML